MNEMRRTTPIVLACAISAGVHLGLVPEHLHEAPALGVSFIVSVFLLALATVAVALRPNDLRAVRLTGLLLAGLLVALQRVAPSVSRFSSPTGRSSTRWD